MALGRLCSANAFSFGKTLFRHGEPPGLLFVAYKQKSVAEQLGLPEPPKRPLIPHIQFIKQHMEGYTKHFPNSKSKDAFVKIMDRWKSLSDQERSKWTSQYEKEKEVYKVQYNAYIEKLSPLQLESIKALKEKRLEDKAKRVARREKKKESENLGKPKYPGNAFMLYAVDIKGKEKGGKDFITEASKKWLILPEQIQNQYKEKAKKMFEEYQKQLCHWEAKMVKQGRLDLVRVKQLVGETADNVKVQKKEN